MGASSRCIVQGITFKKQLMELSQLAIHQKRIKDWSDFIAEGGVQSAQLKEEILSTLTQFKKVLARCWEAKTISSQDEAEISDFERRLQQLNEEARMTVVGKKAGQPARVI